MKTRRPGRLHTLERLQSVQVRQPTVRFRGGNVLYVASVATPSAHPSGAASRPAEQLYTSERVHARSSADTLPNFGVGPMPIPGVGGAVCLTSEHAAKLERAASSGLATTSSSASASPAIHWKRVSGASGKGISLSSVGDGKPSGPRGIPLSFRMEREFQPRAYTAELSNAYSFDELRRLFEQAPKHEINAIHIATLWTRLAKLVSAPATPAATPRGRVFSGPGGAGSADRTRPGGGTAATAGAPQRPEPAALVAFVGSLEAMTTAEQLEAMAPRGLANVVWAAAKLKPESAGGDDGLDLNLEVSGGGGGASGGAATTVEQLQQPRHVETASSLGSSSSASLAVRGSKLIAPLGAPSAVVVRRGGGGRAAWMEGGEEGEEGAASASSGSPLAASQRRPRTLRIRGGDGRKSLAEAAEAEAAASRLSSTVVSEALLDAWAAAASRKLSRFSMQDVSNVVWALGRLGYQPRGLFMLQLSIALLKELPRADRPQQISNVLLGFARLRFTPSIKDFWPPVWEAVQRLVLSEQRDKPDVQGVVNTLWALAYLSNECPNSMAAVPEVLVSKAVFRAVQYGDLLTGQQFQDVFLSLPRLGFQPSEYQASKLLALALRLLPSCDGQALSNILVTLVQLRVQPWLHWKTAALEAFEQQLPSCSPEAVARFMFAWAHMRMPPPVWASQVWEKLHREVHNLTAVEIAFVVLAANQLFKRLERHAKGDVTTPALRTQGDGGSGGGSARDTTAVEMELADPSSTAASSSSPTAEAAPSAAVPRAARRAFKKSGVKARATASGGFKARLPSRQLLLLLRERWEAVGPEAHLQVVFAYRALVQEFFNSLGDA